MIQFLTETIVPLASVVFPLVILSQVVLQVLGALLKLFNRPQIKLHPAGMIEVGFGGLGPTLTLFGTMQALRGDFFITKIDAEVRHTASGLLRSFEWRAFKPYVFGFQTEDEVKYELVAAFSLKLAEPFKYNIVFIDDSFINQQTEKARIIVDGWKTFQAQASGNRPVNEQLEAFYHEPQVQAIAQEWQKGMYWAAGDYQVTLCIHRGKEKTRYPYKFQLAVADEEALRGNIRRIIGNLCGERVSYGKAFVAYLGDG